MNSLMFRLLPASSRRLKLVDPSDRFAQSKDFLSGCSGESGRDFTDKKFARRFRQPKTTADPRG